MGYLLQNEFGAPKDTKVHPGAKVHQAIIRPSGVPTMLKIVLHKVTFFYLQKSVGAPWCTGAGALILP